MPAKRRLTESQAEAFRILCGFTRRRQLLASLEKERLSVERRLLELASRPAEQVVSPCAQANGYHWLRRTEDISNWPQDAISLRNGTRISRRNRSFKRV